MRPSYPHQLRMVHYLKRNQHGALLVEMRLGKTHALIKAYRNETPALVVCPKPVIDVWMDEFEKDGITDYAAVGSKEARLLTRPMAAWTVANYEAAMRMPESIRNKFKVVVLDEAVRIKNPKAQVSKFFVQNFRGIRRCIASGNIAPESSLEYFTPMQFLYNRWMGCTNFWQFRQRYFMSDFKGWQWFPKKGTKERIRDAVNETAFILTRKKAGLANKKVYEQRYLELPKKVRTLYDKMENEFAMTLPDSQHTIEVKHVVAQVSYLAQLAGGGTKHEWISSYKINELVSLLSGELANEAVVVWFRFNWEIHRAAAALTKAKVPHSLIFGYNAEDERREIVHAFQKGKVRVLLVQVKTGLYGLNLSVASTAVYFSNPLSGNERTQSEDRIEHNDKKEPLLYIDLICKKTVDEDVYKALRKKHEHSRYFLGDVVENFRRRFVLGGNPHAMAIH